MTDFVGDATFLPYQAGADRSYVADATLRSFVAAGVIVTGALFHGSATLQPFGASGHIDGPVPLEPYSASGSLIGGDIARVAVQLEPYEASTHPGLVGDAALEPYGASATLARGALLTPSVALAAYTADGSMGRLGDFIGDVTLQPYTASGTIERTSVSRVDATLRAFAASGTLIPGGIMRADASLQPYGALAHAFGSSTFSVDATLQPYIVEGSIEGPAAEIAGAIVINPRTRAVTEYANTPFNSLCVFQGVVLAATADGVVSLTGDDDDGDAIDGLLESGISNLGSDNLKRVPGSFIGYRTSGSLIVTLTVDEGDEYSYPLEPRQDTNLHTSRAKFGRGIKGTYWQWRVENEAGASFDINQFKLLAEELSHRI